MTKAEPTPWRRPWGWKDVAAVKKARQLFAPSRAAEKAYAAQLKDVARKVAGVLNGAPTPEHAQRQLSAYAQALEPWARLAASNMVRKVAAKNDDSWREAAAHWGIDLRGMLGADVTGAMQSRIAANVALIKSLPAEAAARVGELSMQAVQTGMRAEELTARIQAQGEVTKSRAKTIALTEVSKASTALTQARAQSVGSEGYIWRGARDGKQRPSHAAMEGKFVKWDSPPTLDGMTGHAGEFPNCRCYPEPVVHDSAGENVASPMPTRKEEEASGEHKLRSQWERQEGSQVVPHMPREPLPNVERAIFNPGKLLNYSMNMESERGRDKAVLWKEALGIDKRHAAEVERQIMKQIASLPAVRNKTDESGERFNVMVPITGPNGRTVDVLTAWIYDREKVSGLGPSTIPRLNNCFIKGRKKKQTP